MELLLIEDFHPFADALREDALASEYQDWPGHDGQVYKRVCIKTLPGIAEMLEDLFGPIEMLGMGYRLNYNGEPPNQAIHSDMGWGTHALVLYLSEGESGTAFWEHKATQAKRIEPGDIDLFEKVCNDWADVDKWKQRNYIPMKFNRAIIYESALFHSRYPFEAFGDSPETGRLIAVAFFSMRKNHDSESQ